jgi:hypothetical protein
VKKRFFNSTPREEYQLSEAPKFNYMVIYGFLLMAFLTGTCYSLIAPIIVPFCAITFSAAYLTMKYQLFYVYETEHESGGIWWPKIFNLLCFTIGLFQATVFGSLVLKTISRTSASRYPNLIVSPLPFLTVAFWVYCVFVIEPKSSFLSKDLQVSIPDHQREARFETDVLKNRVYNPAVIKLLPKVWVRNDLIPFLSQYYQPKYKDVIDFVRKTNPARLGETKDMENVRRQQRHSLSRSHSKRLRPLSATVASLGLAEQQPLSPELMDGPPEEMTDDISDVPLQVFGDTRSGYQNQYSPTSSPSGSSQQLVRPDVLLLREGSVSSGSTPTSAGQGYSNAYQQRYPDHPRRPSDPSQRQYSDRPSDLYDPNYQRPSETRNERPQLPQRYPQQNGLNGQESRYNPRYDPRYDPSYDPRNQRNY